MRRIISFLLIFTVLAANARQVTPEEAQSIAYEFFNSGSNSKAKKAPCRAVQASRSDENQSESQPYYIFNAEDNAGFVIISGDTRAKKILGYADNGSFETSKTPPQLKYLLENYVSTFERILTSQSEDESWLSSMISESEEECVLLETANWGQGYPYNLMTPEIEGQHCPTGCVATAMAIVMKYHNWPNKGRGQIIYTSEGKKQKCDNEIIYKWDEIPNEFIEGQYNQQQASNVAQLMLMAGYSVNTQYGISESGASTVSLPYNLYRFFKYQYLPKYSDLWQFSSIFNYSIDDWENEIITEINNNRPIIYLSKNHAFVIDGYSPKEDKIHINWGWDGLSNGWYNVNLLIPLEGGINYSEDPKLVSFIAPDKDSDSNYDIIFIDDGTIAQQPIYKDVNLFDCGRLYNGPLKSSHTYSLYGGVLYVSEPFKGNIVAVLFDKDGTIKEKFEYDEPFYDFSENRLDSFEDYQNYGLHVVNGPCEIYFTFYSTIEEDDYVQLFYRKCDDDFMHPLLSHNAKHRKLLAGHNEPSVSTIYWDFKGAKLNKDIFLSVSPTYFDESTNTSIIPHGVFTSHFIITPDGLPIVRKDGEIICSDNYNNTSSFQFELSFYPNQSYKDHNVSIELVRFDKMLSRNVTLDDTHRLRHYISERDAIYINDLVIEGEIKEEDIEFLNGSFPILQKLNLEHCKFKNNEIPSLFLLNKCHLNRMILPNNIKKISNLSFHNIGIHSLVLPETIEELEYTITPFNWGLKNIIIKKEDPIDIDENSFFWPLSELILYVPENSISKYHNHPVWSQFADIIGFDAAMEILKDHEIIWEQDLEEINIEENCEYRQLIDVYSTSKSSISIHPVLEHILYSFDDGDITFCSIGKTDTNNEDLYLSIVDNEITPKDFSILFGAYGDGEPYYGEARPAYKYITVHINSETLIDRISIDPSATVEINPTEHVKIFNFQGRIVFDGKYSDVNMNKGFYIIVTKDGRYKRLIK